MPKAQHAGKKNMPVWDLRAVESLNKQLPQPVRAAKLSRTGGQLPYLPACNSEENAKKNSVALGWDLT